MFELVKATTSDGLILKGLYSPGDTNKPAVIHIHGFGQDFFGNDFIEVIARKLKENQIGFLTVQTRGMGNEYRIFSSKKVTRLCGTKYEILEEAALDLDAWIQFLNSQGYEQIILQGHSLGSIKIIRYLFEGGLTATVKRLILLSPYDKNYLADVGTSGKRLEYIQEAKKQIDNGNGRSLIPSSWDTNSHTFASWYSFYQDSDLSNIFNFSQKDYHFPILNKIKLPVMVIVGSLDPYFHPSNPDHPQEAGQILKKNISNSQVALIDGTKHRFLKKEAEVATYISEFVI